MEQVDSGSFETPTEVVFHEQHTPPWKPINVPSVVASGEFVLNAFVGSSFLSPVYAYKDVEIKIGNTIYRFQSVQDNSGMDCGVGFPEGAFNLDSPTVRWCSNRVAQLVGNTRVEKDQTIVVCKVKTGDPPMECYTILNGLENVSEPLLGRFILHDSVVCCYTGAFAKPVSGGPSPGSFSVHNILQWEEILVLFQSSEHGKKLFQLVEDHAQKGVHYFSSKLYPLALAEFQWVSVFGFFSHPHSAQYVIARNLARGYEELLGLRHQSLAPALAWAKEAQSFRDTQDIKKIIKRIANKIT